VLPPASRLRSSDEFARVVKAGGRAGSTRVVVHLLSSGIERSPRAGFVVSSKVGNSVVRHRVIRRLRPLVRDHLDRLPPGTDLVVRALPAAAGGSSAELAVDLSAAVRVAARKAGARSARQGSNRL